MCVGGGLQEGQASPERCDQAHAGVVCSILWALFGDPSGKRRKFRLSEQAVDTGMSHWVLRVWVKTAAARSVEAPAVPELVGVSK
jgi:hypothetical protein